MIKSFAAFFHVRRNDVRALHRAAFLPWTGAGFLNAIWRHDYRALISLPVAGAMIFALIRQLKLQS
jgi:hypothetical protein